MKSEALINKIPFLKHAKYLGISQKTSFDFSIILFANFINNATNFIANIVIARMFGHEIFGLFSIAVNIALTTLVFSEFGMNLTMVRLYKLHEGDALKSTAVLAWNFYFKLVMLSLLILIAIIFSSPLSNLLAHRADKSFLVAIAILSGGMLGFWSYLKALFQSFDLFKNIAYITFGYAFLRLIFLVISIGFSSTPNVELLFSGIYLFPVILILLAEFIKHRRKLVFFNMKITELKDSGKEIINYSKWVAISSVSYVLIQKILIFMVALFIDINQVAVVSAGLVFTAIFSLINDSARQILFPKIAQLSVENINAYKKKIFKIMPFYFLISLMLIGILSFFMAYSLGEKYKESLLIFWISSIGMAITAGIGFYTIIIHAIQKPEVEAYINVIRLILVLLCIFLVKKYSIAVIVLTYSSIIVFGELVMCAYLSRSIKYKIKNS